MTEKTNLNTKKIEELVFRVIGDVGGAFIIPLAYMGDRLGLFKAMHGAGPLSSAELAQKTKLNERYVREWLNAMVAAEYINYDTSTKKYLMTDEQAYVLANEDSPMFMGGGFQVTTSSVWNVPKIMKVFKTGGGVPLSELGEEVIKGVERMFRPGYINALVQDWLAKVPGLIQKLERGARILDVGCGCGQSTVTMGRTFPHSTIIGVDPDPSSIASARKLANQHGLSNVQFLQLPAHEIPKTDKYDLVCSFDCIHDMAEPVKTLKAIRELLKDDGAYIWAEPNASDDPAENRNLIGKMVAGVSPFYCLTVSLAEQGRGTGNQLGENGARALAREAGFVNFEKLPIENPINQFFLLKR